MLKEELNNIIFYIINNYNQFIGSLFNPWKDLPSVFREKLLALESEINDQFENDYLHKLPKHTDLIDDLSKTLYRAESNPSFAIKVDFLLSEILIPKLIEFSFPEDITNSPLIKKCPKLLGLFDAEGLISSKSLKIGSHLNFEIDNMTFGFHESISYDLQLLLFNLISTGVNVLFRPDLLNVAETDNFQIPFYKASVFGRPFDIKLFTQRILKSKEKWLFERFQDPDDHSYSKNIYRFEVLRTEREKIFYLTELLPIRPESVDSNSIRTYILHSESDAKNEKFIHIDASLLQYNADTYRRRSSSLIDVKVKADYHYKVFRINNEISIDLWWKILVSLYPKNELIMEFLSGETHS
ncbi:hypothetical protein [Leptospira interrogans]|uniref:Uncharacterized protein n=2 Tax=Leptospira interrogans TaxID=173 RepID=A0AAP9WF89_LEPIR|nr:hypothetical protein [Leptospira interrogans]EMM81441.1 hypothetical protein LEP1GSC037_0465 [Leptospira interrogans str. 2006001854]QCO35606.1 hypothetical protein E4414_21570 [Leptospira interrogans]QOI44982.1 hypothetical protein Lepto782_22580 [Leptospira interrogans serovar Canicola]UML82767.1 hypothetical protein FH587_02365 [Leptospira interrogans]UMQ52653.1 hypothetical protein FH582_02185 [Leptospira interrogans]